MYPEHPTLALACIPPTREHPIQVACCSLRLAWRTTHYVRAVQAGEERTLRGPTSAVPVGLNDPPGGVTKSRFSEPTEPRFPWLPRLLPFASASGGGASMRALEEAVEVFATSSSV